MKYKLHKLFQAILIVLSVIVIALGIISLLVLMVMTIQTYVQKGDYAAAGIGIMLISFIVVGTGYIITFSGDE